MKHMISLAAVAAGLALATPAAAQSNRAPAYGQNEEARFDAAQRRFEAEWETYQAAVERYRNWRGSARPGGWDDRGPPRGADYDDPDWDAARYYRAGPNYQERVLTRDDQVFRGSDGQYYCRRPDGTTGLIVGAAAGGLLGRVLAGRRSGTLGTLLGAIAGGAAGSAVERNQIRCR